MTMKEELATTKIALEEEIAKTAELEQRLEHETAMRTAAGDECSRLEVELEYEQNRRKEEKRDYLKRLERFEKTVYNLSDALRD